MNWLDIHASGIQAVGVILQVVTTLVLIGVTIWYAWTTHRQADLMKEQVAYSALQIAQTKETRHQALHPYIHVASVSISLQEDIDPMEREQEQSQGSGIVPHCLSITCSLQNLGQGPALGVKLYFQHPTLNPSPTIQPFIIGANSVAPTCRAADHCTSVVLADSVDLNKDAILWIEYRDIFGQWFATRAPVMIEWNRDGFGRPPRVVRIITSDQGQEIRRIKSTHFPEDTLAVNQQMLSTDWAAGDRE